MTTCLHGMSPRRHHPPGATYERAEPVQTIGATSIPTDAPRSFSMEIPDDESTERPTPCPMTPTQELARLNPRNDPSSRGAYDSVDSVSTRDS